MSRRVTTPLTSTETLSFLQLRQSIPAGSEHNIVHNEGEI